MRIRTRLLTGFLFVIAISAATGIYSIVVIGKTSALTGQLYDRPLMASSFALSATADFERADRMLVAAALTEGGAGLHAQQAAIKAAETTIAEDLDVVEQRFPGKRGFGMVADVKQHLGHWDRLMKQMVDADPAPLASLLATEAGLRDKIEEKLDILVEGAKEEGLNFREEAAASGLLSHRVLWGAVAFTVAAGITIALLIGRGIGHPILAITRTMSELAGGNIQIMIPALDRRDEVGQMAKAVEVFKQNAIDNDHLIAAKAREQTARDRRQAAMDLHTQNFGTSVAGVMASLVQSARDMRAAAAEMSEAAARTSDSTGIAVNGADASSRDLSAVAGAAEEMAASINEISRQVANVTAAVRQAIERASETDAKVVGLEAASDRIGDVLRLISDIAGKTNLLALNATIEAARAGDAGKGFAVVASEVKALAAQTTRATDQIGAQIAAIRTATGEAVGAGREVSSAIGQLDTVAAAIAGAVEQQAAATHEISANVQSVTMATTAAARAMALVLTIAERTGSVSQDVLTAAGEVGQTADTLYTEVNDFLSVMTRDDVDERRAYERLPGTGTTMSLRIGDGPAIQVEVEDISRGGIALRCDSTAPAGSGVQVDLPTGTVSGRVVRTAGGLLVVAFRQDPATLTSVDQALGTFRSGPHAEAA